jgi:diguanylate cyclase (GGDEF)-like protein
MSRVPIPADDARRVEALRRLRILDSAPEERFDRLTRLAKRLFKVPIALVGFVDKDRVWFKSRQGLDIEETPREQSFCAHAIMGDGIMVVPDAMDDERFADNPLVTGDPRIRFYAGRPVKTPDGAQMGTLCILDVNPRALTEEDELLLNDLAVLVEEEFRTLQLVTTDELTGITNRRGFKRIAFHTLALCRRLKRPAALVLLDLDHFKEVNDTLGHQAGDAVLKEFSQHLFRAFRDSDVVARLGGDEFCVLLSGTDEAQAKLPLRALQNQIDNAAALAPEKPRISFSAGVAQYDPAQHGSVDELLHQADLRMYEQKRADRQGIPERGR